MYFFKEKRETKCQKGTKLVLKVGNSHKKRRSNRGQVTFCLFAFMVKLAFYSWTHIFRKYWIVLCFLDINCFRDSHFSPRRYDNNEDALRDARDGKPRWWNSVCCFSKRWFYIWFIFGIFLPFHNSEYLRLCKIVFQYSANVGWTPHFSLHRLLMFRQLSQ